MIDDYLIDCAECIILCFISFLSQRWLTIKHFDLGIFIRYFYSDHFYLI